MSIKSKINNADIISFDIFDTLLVRPYARPDDLFMHMEYAFNVPGFYDARVKAEDNARHNNKTADITIDQIYNEIDTRFKSMMAHELEWERMVLRPNPAVLPLWHAAQSSGKRIIIASDMYLPTDFLADVLKKNGFGAYDALFVSCDTNAIKSDGSMYKHICEKCNTTAKRICHIGDNRHSDYKKACKCGIQAIHIPTIVNQYLKNNKRANEFFQANKNELGASILTAIMAYKYVNPDNNANEYWYNLGYEYAGPSAYAYARYIQTTAHNNNLDNIMFVARDGYTLKRVFDSFNDEIKTEYVYAPRYLNLICRLDYRTDGSDVAVAQQRTIINHYAEHDPDFAKLVSATDFSHETMEQFLAQHRNILAPLAKENFKKYASYLKSKLGDTARPAIVDSITENFSAQLLIDSALPNNITGFGLYWWTINKKNIISHDKYSAFKDTISTQDKIIDYWNLMEFLLTSPEYPIEGIDDTGAPVYKQNVSESEKQIRAIYPNISNGAMDFANDIKNIFNGHDIYLGYDTIVSYINNFIQNPTSVDRKYMNTIKTASTPNNDTYDSLFGAYISPSYVIRHPLKSLRLAKNAYWRTPLQILAVCIVHPIKMHIHGLKYIQIILLPKLQHVYMQIGIKIVNCNYIIQIGKTNED